MKTKEAMTICLAKYTSFTRIRTSFTVIHKIGQAIGSKAHKLSDKSCLNRRLRFSPDVAVLPGFGNREWQGRGEHGGAGLKPGATRTVTT
jgi:hypothetical protein